MAGTLTISTLSDGTNSTSSTNPIKGSAKAWVHVALPGGAVGGITGQNYNVSSVTLTGTGAFTINYTTPLTTTYPAVTVCVDQGAMFGGPQGFGGSTTTSCNIYTWNSNSASQYTPTTGITFVAYSA